MKLLQKLKLKKVWIPVVSVLAAGGIVLLVLLLRTGGAESRLDKTGDTSARTDGNWELTGEWTIDRADSGEETLTAAAAEDSTAWNTFFNLAEDWTVSADMQLVETNGESDCTRLVFGDDYGNVCMVVSAEYNGADKVLLRADELTAEGWKNVYTASEWSTVSAKEPINLLVQRKSGSYKLNLTLTQADETICQDTTKTLQESIMDMITKPGLSVYNSEAKFKSFAVAAKKKTTEVTENDVITAGENVPTDEWLLGENAVHNLIDGASAIIVDGEGENSAWNLKNTLGEEWELSFLVEFGKSYRDSVCARFMFGPEAAQDASYNGLITVSYANSDVMLEIQDKEGGSWITTGSTYAWKPVSSRKLTVKIAKYKEINRIAVWIYDGDTLVSSVFSDEMSESQLAKYVKYGVMVYSSQVRFSHMSYTDAPDRSNMPEVVDRVFPTISAITVGSAETTSDWKLSKNSTYFHENSKPAMVINSKGEEFSYYIKNGLGSSWSISAKVQFGTYYSDTAGARLAFTDTGSNLAALVTVKYSPADSSIMLQAETLTDEKWTDAIKTNWTKGESSFYLDVSGNASGKLSIKLRSVASGEVLMEKEATLPAAVVKRMQVAALATTATQVKYSEIVMNLTGGAVTMTGGNSADGKSMYTLYRGTPSSSATWSSGTGITFNTEGALIVSSSRDIYSYNLKTAISDGFTISTDVLFGPLDSKGLSTSRILLVDKYNSMLALFTIKFSENFEVMVEGQYNDNNTWVSCISDNAWRAVQDNRVHITLSRADGSRTCLLNIRDYSGSTVFSAYCTLPERTSARIAAFALGVDNATVKYTNMYAKATAAADDDNDAGMVAITPTGTALDSSKDWTIETGTTCYSDGSLILNSNSDLYTYHKRAILGDAFTITAKLQFGKLDTQGVSTARIALTDSAHNTIALFTLKYSSNNEVMTEGQYTQDNKWTSIISDNKWRAVNDNIITVKLTREAGSNCCKLTLTDSAGKTFYSVTTAQIPAALNSQIKGFGLGCSNTKVKFSNIVTDAVMDDFETEEIVLGEFGSSELWKTDTGCIYTTDGSLITSASGDVFAYNTQTLSTAWSITTDVVFGTPDADGKVTAMLVLVNSEGTKLGKFTVQYTAEHKITLQGQYSDADTWVTITQDTAEYAVKKNHVILSLSRAAGANTLQVGVCAADGTALCGETTAEIPAAILDAVTGFGLGSSESQVKFTAVRAVLS